MNIAERELIFDMDGTIADLYGVENWLEKLKNEDVSPYQEASPMYDMDLLSVILEMLRGAGFRIMVVSWGSMGATAEYNKRIRKAKLEWLNHHGFPYDEVHVVKYGTPKSNFIKSSFSILVDDNAEIRSKFISSIRGERKMTIDAANENIISQLLELLAAV